MYIGSKPGNEAVLDDQYEYELLVQRKDGELFDGKGVLRMKLVAEELPGDVPFNTRDFHSMLWLSADPGNSRNHVRTDEEVFRVLKEKAQDTGADEYRTPWLDAMKPDKDIWSEYTSKERSS